MILSDHFHITSLKPSDETNYPVENWRAVINDQEHHGLRVRKWTTLDRARFILFPPLVVIGFEMFAHTATCPWAKRPLLLPVACFLAAVGGLLFWRLFGGGPAIAACSMAWGIVVLRVFDLHVPPALAVALLPFVMESPTIAYPFSVGIGTLLMTLWFLFYKSFLGKIETFSPASSPRR